MEILAMTQTAKATLIIQMLMGFILPLILAFVWIKFKKGSFKAIIVGAITFTFMVFGLEKIVHQMVLGVPSPFQQALAGNPIYYAIYGGLVAGVFEEIGRFIAFKFLLKDCNKIEDAVSYGIGHGGMEVVILIGMSILSNYMLYNTVFINGFEAAFGSNIPEAQAQAIVGVLNSIAQTQPMNAVLSLLERTFAVAIHISLSVIVFVSVRNKKIWLLPLAVLLHAMINFPAGLFQAGALTNIYLVELLLGLLTVLCVGMAILIYKKIYNTEKQV